jgi:hypothetical protein
LLPLDSPEWTSLRHVYGPATDTPRHLCALYSGRLADLSSGPLKELLDSLYHQGDPDTAAYAALPHLVSLAEARSGSERRELLHLVGWLEESRTENRPPIPEALAPAYFRAREVARKLLWEMLRERCNDPIELRYLFGEIAACSGHQKLADVLFSLDIIYQAYLESTGEDPLSGTDI